MNREALGFPVAGASESIMFSVALVSKQAILLPNLLLQFWTRQSIFQLGIPKGVYQSTNSMIAGFQS